MKKYIYNLTGMDEEDEQIAHELISLMQKHDIQYYILGFEKDERATIGGSATKMFVFQLIGRLIQIFEIEPLELAEVYLAAIEDEIGSEEGQSGGF